MPTPTMNGVVSAWRSAARRAGLQKRMLYQVTIGERVLAVRLRRDGERTFVSVDDGPEQSVRLDVVRGPLRSLVLGDARRAARAA